MQETTTLAVGVPEKVVPPVMLFRGAWAADGGVARRQEYAVLSSRTGLTVMLDRRAVELAALALGIELARPDGDPIVQCGWCKAVMTEAPVSHGICPPCTAQHFPRRGATAEIGQ